MIGKNVRNKIVGAFLATIGIVGIRPDTDFHFNPYLVVSGLILFVIGLYIFIRNDQLIKGTLEDSGLKTNQFGIKYMAKQIMLAIATLLFICSLIITLLWFIGYLLAQNGAFER